MARNKSKHLDDNYTKVPNVLCNDKDLSPVAKTIYIWMAEKPDNWNYFMKGMVEGLGLNEDTIRKHMQQLIDKGWIKKVGIERQVLDNGKSLFGAVLYDIEVELKKKKVL